MKNLYLVLTLVIAILVLPLAAEAKIMITGSALVSVADPDYDRTPTVGTTNGDEDWSFNDPRVNLYVAGDVAENISVTADLWIANDWSHENSFTAGAVGVATRTFAGATVSSAELERAFVTVKDVAGSGFNLMVGRIDIPFGHEYKTRTNNGDDGKNDFITNSLTDINGRAEGLSVSGSFDVGQATTPLSWELALFNGEQRADAAAAAGSVNKDNDDLAWSARAEVGVAENLTVHASYYTNDETKDQATDPLAIGNVLLTNTLTAGGNLAGLQANSTGFDRDMWEFSADYDFGQGNVMAFWGNVDADTNTGGSREWDYWGVEARYDVDDNAYLAGRYNRLQPDYTGSNNSGEPDMWAIAGGYKLADNAMLKAEWVTFNEDGQAFGAGANVNDAISNDADQLTLSLGVAF